MLHSSSLGISPPHAAVINNNSKCIVIAHNRFGERALKVYVETVKNSSRAFRAMWKWCLMVPALGISIAWS
jgi:hypothetical protein